MIIVRCPFCHHTMNYQPVKKEPLSNKRKRCVYCGRSFKVHSSIFDSRIVKIIK